MNNFSILKDLAKKLDEEVVILVSDLDNIPKDSIERDLINEGINYKIEVKSSLDEGIEFVKATHLTCLF